MHNFTEKYILLIILLHKITVSEAEHSTTICNDGAERHIGPHCHAGDYIFLTSLY